MPDPHPPAFDCDLFLQIRERLIGAAVMGVLRKRRHEGEGKWDVELPDPQVKLRFMGAPEVSLLGADRIRIRSARIDFEAAIPLEGPVLTRVIQGRGSVGGTVEGTLRLGSAGQRLELEVRDLTVLDLDILELKIGDGSAGPLGKVRDALVELLTGMLNRATIGRLPIPLGEHELGGTALTDQPIDPANLRLRLEVGLLLLWGCVDGPPPGSMAPVETEEDVLLHLSERVIADPIQSAVDESLKERDPAIFSERYQLEVERMDAQLVEDGLLLKGLAVLRGSPSEEEGPTAADRYPPIRAAVNTYLYRYQGIDPEKNEIVLLNTQMDYELNQDDLKAFLIAGLKSAGATWGAHPH